MPSSVPPGLVLPLPGVARARGCPAFLRRIAIALLAALSTSCAEQEFHGPAYLRRLALEPVGEAHPEPEPRVRTLLPGPEWSARADAHRLEDLLLGGETLSAFVVESDGGRSARIPGPHDPDTFDQARVTLVHGAAQDFRLVLLRDGRRRIVTEYRTVVGDGQPTTVEFDLGEARRAEEPFDELEIEIRGRRPTTAILAVQLVRRPLELWLPRPEEGARPVTVADETRPAVGLTTGRPLRARFRAESDAALWIAAAVPDDLRRPRRSARVRVRVAPEDGRGKPLSAVLELELDPRARSAWRTIELPCDALAGRVVTAEIALESDHEEDLCAVATPILARRGESPPTVVLVTSDTHRADHLGVARRSAGVRTPFLDGLAARGVLFEDCWSTANITNPSHVSIMTGLGPRDTGVVDNRTALAGRATTLSEVFAGAGYLTLAGLSARHLRHETSGLGQGFDRMTSPRAFERNAAETLAAIDGWIDGAAGLPLFLWLHVFDPHGPYQPPEQYRRLYYPAKRDPYDPALPAPDAERLPHWDDGVRDLEWFVAQYKSEVTYLDARLGEVLSHPRLEDAVIAVTADHGESLLAHGIHFNHQGLYPDTLHVPLLLVWPGAPAGERVEHPVSLQDLGRTLVDLAGIRAAFPGRSLVEPARDAAAFERPRFSVSAHGHSAASTIGGWFLVLHLRDHELSPTRGWTEKHSIELYDLASDPDCLEDLSDAEPERARKLRAILAAWLAAAPTETMEAGPDADPELLAGLAALGYATETRRPAGTRLFDPDCGCAQCERFR